MAKLKPTSSFVCSACGYDSSKWFGKCPSCNAWNTMQEFKVKSAKLKVRGRRRDSSPAFGGIGMTGNEKPMRLSEIKSVGFSRIPTGIEELDRVLGGGIVKGSVVMLAGEPGVGKSTLLLELVKHYGGQDYSEASNSVSKFKVQSSKFKIAGDGNERLPTEMILYASGEESVEQIKGRADRLGVGGDNLLLMAETNIETILDQVSQVSRVPPSSVETSAGRQVPQAKTKNNEKFAYDTYGTYGTSATSISLLIIDSIQTMYSDEIEGVAGSVSQVKYCAQKIIEVAKKTGVTAILVGHVTKEGEVAGPMMLIHMVDVALFFEGERYADLRLLRGLKNRFGATDEVGVFRMTDKGMEEVRNPSEMFLGDSSSPFAKATGDLRGSATTCAMEGTRPILTEIQALVTKSYSPMPRRVGMGVDNNRLNLLTAVLQKILKLPLWDQDIFVKVAGGFKIAEPAADLAICQAIISSFKNTPVPVRTVYFGEVGLLGEVRRVSGEEKRIKEAKKLGFEKVMSSGSIKSIRELIF